LAFGANCGVGASDLLVSILAMTEKRPDAIVIAKANAGIPQWRGAHIHYSGTPALMADYARLAADSGARVIGGCCGTTAEHLAAMRRALDERVPGERPGEAGIVAAIGPLASPPAKAQAPRERRRR
jgi:5-methyltetrahydrofolate--homocysteine methyltransferase